MNETLHHLVARFQLGPAAARTLWREAHIQAAPPDFAKRARSLLVTVGRLQAGLALALVAALAWPRGRAAATLLATLLLGALLALMGQTYQTGADPWQLFAFWALLALPWMLAARRDLLWTFWVLIAATGIGLWIGARPSDVQTMRFGRGYLQVGVDWLMWFALSAFAYAVQRLGWAGAQARWTLRLALVWALLAVTSYASCGLFSKGNAGTSAAGLALVGGTVAMVGGQRARDLRALSVAVLALDVLLISAWGRLLFYSHF